MSVEEKTIATLATMMKMMSNKNRLRLLYSLREKPKTWTELMFQLQMNPKTLQHHLNYLRVNKMVKENKPHGFRLTEAGEAFMELGIEEILSTVKKAKEIVGE